MTRLNRQKRQRGCRPDRNRTIRRQQRWRRRRTTDELKQIALDIHRENIWTDRSIPFDMVSRCFPIISFMEPRMAREVAETIGKRGMIFEYANKAMPRGINGYPMFFSMSILTPGETTIVVEFLRSLAGAEEKVLA